ncbi:hypothetical protein [Oleidesulfovibrio sp.]|uniref:phage fiber-tail adaptor protein n=1 Tax=Oleidesulfovibrio sp. TaxID=2909707 RepID=UPI003A8A9D93
MYPSWPTKLAAEQLDYSVDIASRLSAGETITNVTWSADSSLAIEPEPVTGPLLTAVISGGTPGHKHPVTITVQTSSGRVLAERVLLPIN